MYRYIGSVRFATFFISSFVDCRTGAPGMPAWLPTEAAFCPTREQRVSGRTAGLDFDTLTVLSLDVMNQEHIGDITNAALLKTKHLLENLVFFILFTCNEHQT